MNAECFHQTDVWRVPRRRSRALHTWTAWCCGFSIPLVFVCSVKKRLVYMNENSRPHVSPLFIYYSFNKKSILFVNLFPEIRCEFGFVTLRRVELLIFSHEGTEASWEIFKMKDVHLWGITVYSPFVPTFIAYVTCNNKHWLATSASAWRGRRKKTRRACV